MLRRAYVLLPVGVAVAVAAHAAPWARLGPDGGRVPALAVAPSNPQVLYAGGAAVFRSTDGGLHWSPTADVFPACSPESPPPRVTALAVSATDPDRALAASPQGLFVTEDGGASWRRAGDIAVAIRAVAFNGTRAVASGPGAVFCSPDNGATWESAAAPSMAALCEDPQGATSFFAALARPDADGRSLYHSADGLAWTALPLKDLAPVALRPATDGSSLYIAVPGAGGGLFRIPRDGTEAVRLSDVPSFGLAVRPDFAGWVFSASDPADGVAPVYRTINDGATWDPLSRAFGPCGLRALVLGPDVTPLAGTDGAGVLACGVDDGWRRCGEGLAMATVTGAWRRADGTTLLAATLDGLYRSVDDGISWMRIKSAGRRSVLAVSTAKAGRVWYIGLQGPERSDDYGKTWLAQKSGLPPDPDVARVLPHPVKPDTAFAVLADGSVYRTTTGITSWKRILPPFPTPPETAPDLALAPSHPDTLYAIRPDGLHASEDGGTTWAPRSAAAPDALLAADPADAERLYRAETHGAAVSVSVSADGGTTWAAPWREGGAEGSGFAATFLAADPRRAGRVLLGTNRGLRVSGDGAISWHTEAIGPAGTFCAAWAPAGETDDLLGTDGHGLLRGAESTVAPRLSDLATAVAILRLCLATPTPAEVAFADRDGDGQVTRADAILTLRICLGGSS